MTDDSVDIEPEDVSLGVRNGHPVLEIGGAAIVLRTHLGGSPAEEVDTDYFGDGPYFYLDFGEEYVGGLLEITPEFDQGGGNQ